MKKRKYFSYFLFVFGILVIAIALGIYFLNSFNRGITGNVIVNGCESHPADKNLDYRINSIESLNYTAYYKSQTPWPIAPSPIISSYSLIARALFKSGEVYKCNETGSYPRRWIPGVDSGTNYEYVFDGSSRTITWSYNNFNYNTYNLTVNSLINHNIFFDNETVTINSANAGSRILVYDYRSNVIYNGTVPGVLGNLTSGHYFVECSCGDRNQFMVLPRDYKGASFLGDDNVGNNVSYAFSRAKRIQPKVFRLIVHWKDIENVEGQYNFTNLDANINAVLQLNAEKIIGALWWRPNWMLGTQNDARFISRFVNYSIAMARHYNQSKYVGKVAFEIYNEPHYEGTVGQGQDLPFVTNARTQSVTSVYYNLLANSYDAIKAVNPNYEVVGVAITRPFYDYRFSYFVNLGGLSKMDSMGDTYKRKYPYEGSRIWFFDENNSVLDGEEYNYSEEKFDDLMIRWKSNINNKPLYNYEGALFGHSALGIPNSYKVPGIGEGEFSDSNLSYVRGANRAIKQVIMGRAANLNVIINHVWNSFTTNINNNLEMYGWEYLPIAQQGGRGP